MRRVPAIALLVFLTVALPCISWAQQPSGYIIKPITDFIPGAPLGTVETDFAGTYYASNMLIQYNGATIMADSITVNQNTGDAVATGHVRIEHVNQIWVGDHITYNFKTHLLSSGPFRTGKPPFFAQGESIEGNSTNHTYSTTRLTATSDDTTKPDYYVRAKRMTIVPGQYVEAWNAVAYVKGVPVFYYPYYRRSLGRHVNTFYVMPGQDSMYGPFLYGTYAWWLNDNADGLVHLDYREKRGFGGGPDLNLHLGHWGEAQLKYYYLYDKDPNESISTNTFQNIGNIPNNRQRLYFGWHANPYTNFQARALVNYQSDQLVLHDYFQSDWGQNPQPNTFVEANEYLGNNWSLGVLTTPRVNDFFDQIERLPEVKLNGFRQQIFNTPVYYESQSSAGYYDSFFAGTNTIFGATNNTLPSFSAPRVDTFQQLLLPETFFGWLNFTPRVGGRMTWYGPENGPGGTNSETTRFVFNSGADLSFKASQLWPDVTNSVFDIDGLRHIVVPSVSYAYVPNPSVPAYKVPQFDTLLPSLMILPVEFPDYNDIDAIESENVVRFGIRNTLQTKRNGQLDNLIDWNVMFDWNLTPNGQTNSIFLQPRQVFSDVYSSLLFKPRSWVELESQLRYDVESEHFNLAFNQITFTPNDRWSFSFGHWYLHDGFVDSGDNAFTSTLFYRLDQNWGFRASGYYNVQTGLLQQQNYSIYRDMRSWTAALTFRVLNNGNGQARDYGVAFSISLKASPRYHVGTDAVRPYDLLGQ